MKYERSTTSGAKIKGVENKSLYKSEFLVKGSNYPELCETVPLVELVPTSAEPAHTFILQFWVYISGGDILYTVQEDTTLIHGGGGNLF